jgi:hypothetical protein
MLMIPAATPNTANATHKMTATMLSRKVTNNINAGNTIMNHAPPVEPINVKTTLRKRDKERVRVKLREIRAEKFTQYP